MGATDELVDIVDERDRVVGRATRAEMRARGLRCRAAFVLVFNSRGQLFVHRRTEEKDIYPGYYDVAVGGVLAAGETYDEAARRELAEELGISGLPLKRMAFFRFDDERNRLNGMVYSCTWDGPLRLQREEIASGELLDLDVVAERIGTAAFCPDGLEALSAYLTRLQQARQV